MGLLNSLNQFAASAAASFKTGGAVEPSLEDQRKPQTALKEEVWEMASKQAKIEGRDKVTWSDYQIAALDKDVVAKAQTLGMNEKEWRNASVSQKSVTIKDATIRKSELTPSADMRAAAMRNVRDNAAQTGIKPILTDVIQQVRAISDAMEKNPALSLPSTNDAELQGLEALFDLDGDQTVSKFYAANAEMFSFDNAHFEGVTFHPAGTLTEHHTHGASFTNCVFDGMSDKDDGLSHMSDHVVLKGGEYNNIRFTNIKGGEISLADGAQIHGMDISGATAKLSIGKASIDNLQATNARIISINAKPGAVISDSNLTGLTVDGNSTLQGVKLERVNFKSANLRDVDLRGAVLNQVKFENSDLKDVKLSGTKMNGVDFSNSAGLDKINLEGASLKNVQANGVPIRAESWKADITKAMQAKAAQEQAKNLGVIKDLTDTYKTFEKPKVAVVETPVIERPVIGAPKAAEPKPKEAGALDSLKYVKAPEVANLENPLAAALLAGKQIEASWLKPSEPSSPPSAPRETPQRTAETAAKTNQMSMAQTKDYYSRNQGRSQTGTA